MKQTQIIMGMPITVEIVDEVKEEIFKIIFDYFKFVDEKFSIYKKNSEINQINNKKLTLEKSSKEMQEIFFLAEKMKNKTKGFFDIKTPQGIYDPSGIVKGWAIQNSAKILSQNNLKNFYIEAGGDIIVSGKNSEQENWKIGIRNPFNINEVVKTITIKNQSVATSGNYIRGEHIYNPHNFMQNLKEIVSLTVIGPTILETDCLATASFAMGRDGIYFIETMPNFAGYMIDKNGIATMTTNFSKYISI